MSFAARSSPTVPGDRRSPLRVAEDQGDLPFDEAGKIVRGMAFVRCPVCGRLMLAEGQEDEAGVTQSPK